MKPRKDRKFSRLRSRFPLGALITVEKVKSYGLSAALHPRPDWEYEFLVYMVVGTWRSHRLSAIQSKVIDSPGIDPRSRVSKNESGYLLLACTPDTPLARQVFDEYNMNNMKLLSVIDDVR